MIITKATAQKHIKDGKACAEGRTYHDGITWMIVVRLDKQRIDHYPIGHSDLRNSEAVA